MAEVRVAHTAELGPWELAVVRAVLDAAFAEGDFTDDDWEHALGGLHVLVAEGAELVAHAAVVQRRMLYRDQALRTGYVEAVAVRPDRQGRGHAATLMREVERIVQSAYTLGALSAAAAATGLYAARSWQLWHGRSFVLSPRGRVHTEEDDGSIFVLPTPGNPLDVTEDLTCDWRAGDVW